jgi:hypothetical protein
MGERKKLRPGFRWPARSAVGFYAFERFFFNGVLPAELMGVNFTLTDHGENPPNTYTQFLSRLFCGEEFHTLIMNNPTIFRQPNITLDRIYGRRYINNIQMTEY